MNVLLTQYSEISVLKGKERWDRGTKEEGEEVEGEVSYSVSSDLQITSKMISWKLYFK